MEIQIRKFTKSDATALLSMYHDTVQSINTKDYNAEQVNAWMPSASEGIDAWKERFTKEKAIVAEIDGGIIGFGTLHENHKAIGMLYVSKNFQGRGAGRKLLKKLEKKLKKREVKTAKAEVSLTARPFFEKQGYQWVRDNRKMVNGQEFINFIMEKPLKEKKQKMGKEKPTKPGSNWSDILKQKFIDLIIVIVGVSIAFQLNNLKIEKDQNALEQFYYESLLSDINKDIENTTFIIGTLKEQQDLAKHHLVKLQGSDAVRDSLGQVIKLFSLESFSGNDNTYKTLLSSNGLNTFKDRNVRKQITEYYRLYAFVQRFQDVQTKLLLEFYNYLSPHCDIARQEITDPAVYEMVQTRNYLITFVNHLGTGIEDYQETLDIAKSLKKTVEAQVLKY